jgi:hypothetical protein
MRWLRLRDDFRSREIANVLSDLLYGNSQYLCRRYLDLQADVSPTNSLMAPS